MVPMNCPVVLQCNNKATINIIKNSMHQDRKKHVEIDPISLKES